MSNDNNIYDLIRDYWNWCFENSGKVKPLHTAIYFFAINQFNRFGWKDKIGFPASLVMEATGINTYASYKKALDELIGFGFLEMKIKSKNQYTANIIALSKTYKALCKAPLKALDKATLEHATKQSECNNTNLQYNKSTNPQEEQPAKKQVFCIPPISDVISYFIDIKSSQAEANKFYDYYTSNGWKVSGRAKMVDWKASARGWHSRNIPAAHKRPQDQTPELPKFGPASNGTFNTAEQWKADKGISTSEK